MVKLRPVKSGIWLPIQFPKELVRDLETFADSGVSRALGFTNKSQIAAFAIREFLANYSDYLSMYQITDFSENEITLIDHEENKVIHIKYDGQFLHCDVDDEPHCDHIKFALSCPAVLKVVKKLGYPDENNKN